MKDHEIAELINEVRDVAREFGQTQQLRERLASLLIPVLKQGNIVGTYTQTVKVKDGCISPHWELGTHCYSSGYLKYFHKYEGKKVRVTLQFLDYEDEIFEIEE